MNVGEEYDKLALPMTLSSRVVGSWPSRAELEGQGGRSVLVHRLHRYLAIVSIYLMSMGVAAEVIVFFGEDMNETIECALISSAFFMALTRIITFASHQPEMLYVVETMREDWIRSTDEERAILRDKCLFAFKLAKFFAISVTITCSAFILMPMLELKFVENAKRMLPYRGYFFFNHTVPGVYEYVYLVNSMLGVLGCSTIACATSFSLITSIHGAAKFAIVQKDFERIDQVTWNNSEIVGRCVRRHQECIRFAETVENIINVLALAQFVISTGLICFAGFQMTTMLTDRARFTKYASFLNAAVTELFIFSYGGQSLKSESEEVAEGVYSSNWIGSALSSNLRLIVLRSRKPCTITAGKFYDMSFESFLKVLSSSFSYFTVLLAMEEE
ncbi:odorant receptor 296 [Nasonia vitripennis]|uniref:Odorant receptor n=2 Tax=Nasonia vitripennis TaxID=7425 RepID=A0A7M6USM1_NASVI|nr:odorant receptor 296 [Nasonia vitripennis]